MGMSVEGPLDPCSKVHQPRFTRAFTLGLTFRAREYLPCALRGSVWLADEKVRLAGGDKRGLITLLFVARPSPNLPEINFEAFTTVDYYQSCLL